MEGSQSKKLKGFFCIQILIFGSDIFENDWIFINVMFCHKKKKYGTPCMKLDILGGGGVGGTPLWKLEGRGEVNPLDAVNNTVCFKFSKVICFLVLTINNKHAIFLLNSYVVIIVKKSFFYNLYFFL